MCSQYQDEEIIQTDALYRFDDTITVSSDSNDRTTHPGKVSSKVLYPNTNYLGNIQAINGDKPILINSSKGGIFQQGQTIGISPRFKNTVCYQWIKNGIALPNCTGPTLEISNATLYDSGDYALIACNQFGIEITHPISVRIV